MIHQIGESISFGVQVSGIELIDPVLSNFSLECIIIDGPGGENVHQSAGVLSEGVFIIHVADDVVVNLDTRDYVILCTLYHSALKFSQYVINEVLTIQPRGSK